MNKILSSLNGVYRKIFGFNLRSFSFKSINNNNLFFLISAPRSGSTWTRTALNFHPEICCVENNFFGGFYEVRIDEIESKRKGLRCTTDSYIKILEMTAYQSGFKLSPREFQEKLLAELMGTLLEFYRRESGKKIICEKITPYLGTSSTVMEGIKKYFPNSKIIYLHRDGRDIVVSAVFDWLKKNIEGQSISDTKKRRYKKFVKGDNLTLSRFFEDDDIETWVGYWKDPLEHISSEAGLITSYELLRESQEEELKRIFRFIGVPVEHSVVQKCVSGSSFKKMSRGRKAGEEVHTAKVRKGIIGDWRKYFTRRDGELFNNLAGKYLIELGYEKDKGWIKNLPESLSL